MNTSKHSIPFVFLARVAETITRSTLLDILPVHSMKSPLPKPQKQKPTNKESPSKATSTSTKSFKSRQQTFTSSKLHVTTKAEVTGHGSKALAIVGRKGGQGGREVWLSSSTAPTSSSSLSSSSSSSNSNTSKEEPAILTATYPEVEIFRSKAVTKLSTFYTSLCKPLKSSTCTGVPPQMSFEKYMMHGKLGVQSGPSKDIAYDPMLLSFLPPTLTSSSSSSPPPNVRDKVLYSDLLRGGYSDNAASRICNELDVKSSTLAKECYSYLKDHRKKITKYKTSPTASGEFKPMTVSVVKHKHSYDVIAGLSAKHLLKVNIEHYDKLLLLYTSSNPTLTTAIETETETGTETSKESFHVALYDLLKRYQTASSHGYQASCPLPLFKTLTKHFNVTTELFASPLNCNYPDYYSVYHDTDSAFGSHGSFWNASIVEGSYQVNPPFVTEIMTKMSTMLISLLDVAESEGKELSFIVIVPGWSDEHSYTQMSSSRYLDKVKNKKGPMLISKADHGFTDGAQHQRRDRHRSSPYDTAVFHLRTTASKTAYPRTKESDQGIREGFAMGCPSKSEKERRVRDGRGFGDEDGGGGVFKGKSGNRKVKVI